MKNEKVCPFFRVPFVQFSDAIGNNHWWISESTQLLRRTNAYIHVQPINSGQDMNV